MQEMEVPQGQFSLARYPVHARDKLRAWDAADEYLLQWLAGSERANAATRVWIFNDRCGALALALTSKHQVQSISDSYVARQALEHNLAANGLPEDTVETFDSLVLPEATPDLIVLKIPKSSAMLEFQLAQIRQVATASTLIVAAAMAKHIHTSTLSLFEKYIGPTKTSLAQKKARLVFPLLDQHSDAKQSPWPDQLTLEGFEAPVLHHANVFSREGLDIGTRFMLSMFEQLPQASDVVDLGCGNGLLGIRAAQRLPEANVAFADESWMALVSAQANVVNMVTSPARCSFHFTHCLHGLESESADLVLNNPPFHQDHAVGDFIATQMFRDAWLVLRDGGELWVVGNRHLSYHVPLKKRFGMCETLASNSKFVIWRAVKNSSNGAAERGEVDGPA